MGKKPGDDGSQDDGAEVFPDLDQPQRDEDDDGRLDS